ncbi:MAG: hypothetical protein ACJA2Q_001719 [Pseudohongiellaceae bacterium]|jgi:hypothetical protein
MMWAYPDRSVCAALMMEKSEITKICDFADYISSHEIGASASFWGSCLKRSEGWAFFGLAFFFPLSINQNQANPPLLVSTGSILIM